MTFVVVKVYSLDSKWKNITAQIIDGPDEDGDFEAIFLKRSLNIKDDFFYPEIEDLASVELADVMKTLPMPMSTMSSNRRIVFKFNSITNVYIP